MKQTRTSQIHHPMFIRGLKISTRILLHPEFSLKRRAFANRHGVNLVDAPAPETSFKKAPDDPYNQKRNERIKANIHLVRHGAINLFTERDEDGEWIQSIKLAPAMLLYDTGRHPLQAGDLPLSLSILRKQVSPLLANSHDAGHIIPGLVQDEEAVAYWSEVDTEFLFPGINIRCLHGLSHPLTGAAEGAKPNRIQLGDRKDECVIRIKEAKWESEDPNSTQTVEGIRVRLILKGRALTEVFTPFGKTAKVNDTKRLVAFSEPSIARVHQSVMAHLEGMYLPIPAEWRDPTKGKRMTLAKAIALVSQLTSIPVEEIRAMDEEIRHPSKSTRKLLRKDVPVEASRLVPVPVASLFDPSAYAIPNSEGSHPAYNIDPTIAHAYAEA